MQDCHRKITAVKSHWLIIAAFTLLQLVVLAVNGYTPYPDSNGYIILANDCVSLGDLYPATKRLQELAFVWNVGAIDAVIASLKLSGSIVPLLIVYSLMKGATAWLLYEITAKIFGQKTALVALILYVVYPANYGEGTSVQSETPFIFFVMLGLYAAICRSKYFAGGAIIAFANWFRPMGLVFLLALMLYSRRKIISQAAGYAALVCLIGSMAYLRTGHFIYQAKTGWMALLQYSVDNSVDKTDNSLVVTTNADAVEKDDIWRKRFFYWLKTHPGDYLRQIPVKMVKTYVSDNINICVFMPDKDKKKYMYEEIDMRHLASTFPHYSAVQWLAVINLLYYYLLMIGFVGGIVLILRQKEYDKAVLPLAVIVIGTGVLLFFGHGESRFHIPFMPFVIMSAAWLVSSETSRPTSTHGKG